MKGTNNYAGATNEVVLISGPNCDNSEGYVYGEYTILWQNDIFILYGADDCWPNLNKKEHVHIKQRISKEIYDAYVELFGKITYPHIDKAIDADGWYSSEKNDQWLVVQPHLIKHLDFRNDNKDLRPKALNK